jgi:WD40 repeat protein
VACGFENCAMIWDLEKKTSFALLNVDLGNECVSSLAWMPNDENIIVTGTLRGWVHIYDDGKGS